MLSGIEFENWSLGIRGRNWILFGFAVMLLVIAVTCGSKAADDGHPLRLFKAEAAFDDVKFDLENAIVNAGLKIIYHGNIGEMLERTGGEVGSNKKIYAHAEFFTFCSAPNSHATMNADPRNIGFCPYLLYVYQLAGDKDVTYIGYRRPVAPGSEASIKALRALDEFLENLVKKVVE